MNKQKQLYLSPETETLVVQVEETVLTGSQWDNSTPNINWGSDVVL